MSPSLVVKKFPCATGALKKSHGENHGKSAEDTDKAKKHGACWNGCEKFSHGNASRDEKSPRLTRGTGRGMGRHSMNEMASMFLNVMVISASRRVLKSNSPNFRMPSNTRQVSPVPA